MGVLHADLVLNVHKRVFRQGQQPDQITGELILVEQFPVVEAHQLGHIGIGVVESLDEIPDRIAVVFVQFQIAVYHGAEQGHQPSKRGLVLSGVGTHKLRDGFHILHAVKHESGNLAPQIIHAVDVRLPGQGGGFIERRESVPDVLFLVLEVQHKGTVLSGGFAVQP